MQQGCHTGHPKAYGQAGVPIHHTRHELGILDIFSKYSFKIPQICSNILNISLSGGCGGLTSRQVGGRSGRAGRRTNNLAMQ